MSLIGRLQDFPLPELLQILSLSKRSGVLTIVTTEGRSFVVFRDGLILNAFCPSANMPELGRLLVEQGYLNQERLLQLLELQKTRANEPLGWILLEAGIVDRQTLQDVIKNQIRTAIRGLLDFHQGSFSFASDNVTPFDEIHYNPLERDFQNGVELQQILLERAKIRGGERKTEDSEPATFHFEPDLNVTSPTTLEDIVTYEQIREIVGGEPVGLNDLEVPSNSGLPEVPFEQIASEIDFPQAPEDPLIAPLTPVPARESKSRLTVLLVDDEAFLRQIMGKHLREKGIEVIECDGSAEALRISRQLEKTGEDFWILTDLVMPSSAGTGFLGGLEIVEQARNRKCKAPIIVLFDYDDPKAKTRAFNLGVFSIQKKPVLSRVSLREAQDQINRFTDTLVQLMSRPNSGGFEDSLWAELANDSAEKSFNSAANMFRKITDLQQSVQEAAQANEPWEISSLILGYATEFLDRALLFRIEENEVAGLGGFGDTGDREDMQQKAARAKFPLSPDSIFAKIVTWKKTHCGKLPDTPSNRKLVALTGRLAPRSVALLPLLCAEQVIAVLYGDNAVSKKPIQDLEGLEIFLVQTGLVIENALAQNKIEKIHFR